MEPRRRSGAPSGTYGILSGGMGGASYASGGARGVQKQLQPLQNHLTSRAASRRVSVMGTKSAHSHVWHSAFVEMAVRAMKLSHAASLSSTVQTTARSEGPNTGQRPAAKSMMTGRARWREVLVASLAPLLPQSWGKQYSPCEIDDRRAQSL